ncbi:pentatricopeptide repeat-containing protein [Prunus yedoensis var. nudiflora]|uniref:Pentatricopeptide repeat-containing protein n=1 Tax=Prunus yedoensis var. nudiflora TaxID=2094558 RepID=A0A314ZPE4_PRUYE|nr:pentatricopeptide repeat-containing protein [Prunus yedoensis var. nudiflora]
MDSNQIKGNSQTRSILTWALLKLHKYEEVEHFMRTQMTETSKFQSNRIWDSLIQGLCINRKDPEKALLILRDCLINYGWRRKNWRLMLFSIVVGFVVIFPKVL